jgi:hypothetical protein
MGATTQTVVRLREMSLIKSVALRAPSCETNAAPPDEDGSRDKRHQSGLRESNTEEERKLHGKHDRE